MRFVLRIIKHKLLIPAYRLLGRENQNRLYALLNKRHYLLSPLAAIRSARVIQAYREKLRALGAKQARAQGVTFLHFVYGFKESVELPLYAFLAIKSAQYHNPHWPVVFSYVNEPTGPWWDKIKNDIHLVQLSDFQIFKGARFYHYAHKADVVRLLALQELGGVYLDIDTITQRPFTDLLPHEFGMSVQPAAENSAAGLCNAVMWGHPGAAFVRLWLDKYSFFRSHGRTDHHWDYHSVRLPATMLKYHPDLIVVLPYRAFFAVAWPDVARIMFTDDGARFKADLEIAYGFHLWNTMIEKQLLAVTPEWVQSSKSIYAVLARPVLKDWL